MRCKTAAGLALVCCAAMTSCAAEKFTNAPPAIVDECRRQIALLSNSEPPLADDPLQSSGSESTRNPIEAAKAAKAEREKTGIAGWPDEVRMYYCLESNGVILTPDQARKLAEWKNR